MPFHQFFPSQIAHSGSVVKLKKPTVRGYMFVPMDDENCTVYNWTYTFAEQLLMEVSREVHAGVTRGGGVGDGGCGEEWCGGGGWGRRKFRVKDNNGVSLLKRKKNKGAGGEYQTYKKKQKINQKNKHKKFNHYP